MSIKPVDPFDLPEWLGTEHVTWSSIDALAIGPQVAGRLTGDDPNQILDLDLLAVDVAYPRVVCPDAERHDAHQAWQFGEVALFDVDGRVVAGVPTHGFDANLACEAIRRVARAVGAEPGRFAVSLRL